MAEEDILFGKNRHFFGGIEPSNMIRFSVVQTYSDQPLKRLISMTLPKDTVVNGQTLCTISGVVVRRKTGGYPEDEFDGDLVRNISASGGESVYIRDTLSSSSTIYYYQAFPYTTQGVYNRNKSNRCTSNSKNGYLYGFDLSLNTSSSSTRVSYPEGVDNEGASYTSSTINNLEFLPKPCVLYQSGVVKEYLDPNDYSKTENGETSSYNADVSKKLNVMLEWPKIYTHREVINNVYKFRCSNVKIGDDWVCWCNYDSNGNEIDNFYTGAYLGYVYTSNSKDYLCSIGGKTPSKMTTTSSIASAAEANGDGWSVDLAIDRLLIQDLLVLIYKKTNFDGSFDTYSSNTTGTLTVGQSDGLFNADPTKKAFGMEYLCSGYYRYLSGLINDKGALKIKIPGKANSMHIGNNSELPGTGSNGGWVRYNTVMPFGRFPSDISGASGQYESDYMTYNNTYSYPAYAYPGSTDDDTHGLFAISFANITSIYSSLSYKPLAE